MPTEKAAWRPKKGFAAKEAVCGALGLKLLFNST